jgi:AcrR family transcriptional regulator
MLMVLFAATVYARGLTLTRLSDVAAQAGVPAEAVAKLWPSEIDCLLDTAADFTHRLFQRVATAFMEASADGPYALHQALREMVHDMADEPEMTYLATVELPALGPLVYERHDRMLDLFCGLLTPAFAELDRPLPDREIISLCIGGGVWETVRRHALNRRLDRLPDALPAISYVCLSSLFGDREACRVSTLACDRQRPAA